MCRRPPLPEEIAAARSKHQAAQPAPPSLPLENRESQSLYLSPPLSPRHPHPTPPVLPLSPRHTPPPLVLDAVQRCARVEADPWEKSEVCDRDPQPSKKPEKPPSISRVLRQFNATVFFAHCQRESDQMQHMLEEAKQYAIRRAEAKKLARCSSSPLSSPPSSPLSSLLSFPSSSLTSSLPSSLPSSPSSSPPSPAPLPSNVPAITAYGIGMGLPHHLSRSPQQVAEVTIRWSNRASQVEVRFGLDGWGVRHHMTASNIPGVWELRCPLPALTRVEFKFVVDGEWQLHPSYATLQDRVSGHVNNILVPVHIQLPLVSPSSGEVYVCSQLDGWSSRRPMERSACDPYLRVLGMVLPGNWIGPFQFKFVVGGKWTTSPHYRVVQDGSFANNMIFIHS